MSLRDYLVEFRLKKGLSQQDMAERLGISRQYYQMIERGERQKRLDLALAGALAALLEVNVMDIQRFESALICKDYPTTE